MKPKEEIKVHRRNRYGPARVEAGGVGHKEGQRRCFIDWTTAMLEGSWSPRII